MIRSMFMCCDIIPLTTEVQSEKVNLGLHLSLLCGVSLERIAKIPGRTKMTKIETGSMIGIPCEVSEGAFEGEMLVDFETMDGRISGFTSPENIKEIDAKTFIKAKVVSVESDHFVVMVRGSFFSTNGLANVELNQPLPLAA